MPLPDWVVCSGKESVEIIRAHCVALHPVLTLGGAIRYEHLRGFKKKTRVAIRRILIAAEGVFEVIPMLKYVLEQIGGHTKYQLTFRFHPALPYEKFNREHGPLPCKQLRFFFFFPFLANACFSRSRTGTLMGKWEHHFCHAVKSRNSRETARSIVKERSRGNLYIATC